MADNSTLISRTIQDGTGHVYRSDALSEATTPSVLSFLQINIDLRILDLLPRLLPHHESPVTIQRFTELSLAERLPASIMMAHNMGKEAFPLFQYNEFDVGALCHLASEMRRGLTCTCDLNQRPKRGGYNWAVFVLFEDGLEWVLRSPVQNHPSVSDESVVKLLLSETATLKYLKTYTDVPVPDVYSYW
mgnify:FL=1|jgi:hypothetical protein